ncbi:MAG: hypothetical protein U5P10_00890 [Spirochaetia bacterium]|nr:hypothetical protein [Spirochaetia bacterium]
MKKHEIISFKADQQLVEALKVFPTGLSLSGMQFYGQWRTFVRSVRVQAFSHRANKSIGTSSPLTIEL